MEAPYLDNPAFHEPHDGPLEQGQCGLERSPSQEQIAAMCIAIQATWTEARLTHALGRTVTEDEWRQRQAPSDATHIPHGLVTLHRLRAVDTEREV